LFQTPIGPFAANRCLGGTGVGFDKGFGFKRLGVASIHGERHQLLISKCVGQTGIRERGRATAGVEIETGGTWGPDAEREKEREREREPGR